MYFENKASHIISSVLCLIFCVPFTAAYFSYAMGIFFLFLLWQLRKDRRELLLRPTAIEVRRFVTGLAVFYGLCLLSGLLRGDVGSIKRAWDIAMLSLPFFMLNFLQTRYAVSRAIQWGLLLGAFTSCLIAFFVCDERFGLRMASIFGHPNTFAVLPELLLPFTVWHFLRSKHTIEKLLITMIAAIMLYCLWHTESRGAMVALAAGIGLSFFVMAIVQRKAIGLKKLAVLAVSACLVLSAGAGLLYEIQSTRSERSARGGERIEMLEASYEMWRDHKLLGVGLANWQENYYSERYHPENGIEEGLRMPHNMPAYFFSTAGLLGGTGYLAFLILSFAALYRTAGRAKDKWLAAAALAAFFAFHIHGLVDSTIINKIPARLFFALMGYSLAVMLPTAGEKKPLSQ